MNSREAYRFVVREDEPAVAAASAVGRGFVAVVIDRKLRPVGTLRGSSSAAASPTSDARRVDSRRDGGGGGGGRPEGTGTEAIALATAAAAGRTVGEVMGPPPVCLQGDTATVGDVAVLCAAAARNAPVALVDAEGRLQRVLRQEDLLEPARGTGKSEGKRSGKKRGGGGGGGGGRGSGGRSRSGGGSRVNPRGRNAGPR